MVEIPQTQTPLPSEEAHSERAMPRAGRNAYVPAVGEDADAIELRREEETRLLAAVARSLLNATADASLLVDLNGFVLAANATAIRTMGQAWHWQTTRAYPIPENLDPLIGACLYDLLPPECATARKAKISEAIDTKQPVCFKDECAGKNCDNRIHPVFDARGQIVALAIYEGDAIEKHIVKSHGERVRYEWTEQASLDEKREAIESQPRGPDITDCMPVEEALREKQRSSERMLGTAEDITERKQALLRLRDRERMLQLVMDNIPQAIFWKDRNSVYVGCNEKFAKNAGIESAQNIVGRTDYDLAWKREEADFFRQCDRRIMETDTAEYHIIEPQLQADGKQAWLDTNKIPLHDATGQVVGILGTYEDITDRLQMEAQLKAAEERFRLLVDGVKDYAIFMLDPEGRVISWNAGAERIKGYRAEDILGVDYSCFYEAEERQWGKPAKQLKACAVMGRFEDEGWRVRKDCSRFWASAVMTALLDESGQLRGFAKVVRDISDRRQAEKTLQKANEQLGINVEVRTTELKLAIEQLHQEIAHSTQAEAELRKSESQYRLVIDNLKEVIFQTDEVGLWTFLNPAWTEITGFSVEESLGKLFIDFVHPDDRQRNLELFAPLVEGHTDYCRHEIRYLTKNGGSRWLEVFVRQTLDERGYAIGTAGTLNDITERKQAEAALRESEERFRRAFEDVATGMALVGIDGRYLQVNRALCEMLGYSESELTATTFAALTHPDDLQSSLEVHRRVQAGEVRCQQLEKRYIHKDGHTVWGQLTTSLVYNDGGQPLYYVSQIQDITERNLAEAQLRESEERFRQLAENVDEVFWIFTPDRSQLLYVSPMYEPIWGRPRSQLYRSPRSWLEAVHPEDRERLFAAVKASGVAIEQSQSIDMLFNEEYRIIRPDGSIRWIWARSFPVRNETGKVYRLCGVAKDITGRKQAEEELHRTLAKEKELSELRSRFVTMVSHEFRTPLATILSSADLLEYYFEEWPDNKNEKKLEHLQRIQTAAITITQMLNDVLVIGRADAGKIEFNPTPIDLADFCRELVEEMQISVLHTHTILFSSRCGQVEGDRPRNSASVSLPCLDEKLLRHILNNLLSNALKYSPNGDRVEFTLACQDEWALFQIRDFGIGIPPDDQPRLFEAFHRARNVGDIPGTGLGLAIVKRAVDIHGGQITVESEVGVGTTFTVALPLFHSLPGIR